MQEIELTDAAPEEVAETALEAFRAGGTVTVQYPEGNSVRSESPSELDAPYKIENAENGVRIQSKERETRFIPVREGSALLARY